MRDLMRRFGPARLGVLAVMVTGAVLLLLGLAFGTIGARPSVTTVRVVGQAGAPVVVTTAEALALDGPSVRVDVKGPDPAKPVFVGVGREGDVSAYLGGAARTEVTGVDGDRAVSSRTGSDSSLPEPTGVDVWALSATGPGSATLTWPQAPGRWRLVAAVDGATPPAQVVITWQRDRGGSPVPVLLAVGALLLVLGFVGSRVIGRDGRPAATPAPDRAPAPGAVPPPTSTAPPGVRVSGRRRADRNDGARSRGARDVGALHENALDHEPVDHGSLDAAHPDHGHPDDGPVDAVHLGDDDLDDDAEEAPAVPAPFRRPQSPSAGGPA